MSGLLEGWDWFDNALQRVLGDMGLGSYTKSQSMVILYVSAGVSKPSEVARRMRLSRQAIRHIQCQLEELGIIRVERHPGDARVRRLVFNEDAVELGQTARNVILALEGELAKRVGEANLAALRTVLDMNWGAPIDGLDELQARNKPLLLDHHATTGDSRRKSR
jgi:DNA-binding MarR family transcriptional regulator